VKIEFTKQQLKDKERYRRFVNREIAPYADDFDRAGRIPTSIITSLAKSGCLGAAIPKCYGGEEVDYFTAGLMFEEIGRGSASILSLMTVHGMVSLSISKWGTDVQRKHWLPKLSSGDSIGAFALTEPLAGSDTANIQCTAIETESGFQISGEKKWISFGQLANIFLVIAKCDNKPTAFLVEGDREGFISEPIVEMEGFRSAMLAKLTLEQVHIPKENLLGQVGFGLSHVVGVALDYGRFCIACGCVGLAQACLEDSVNFASSRKQGGVFLTEHQLIQKMLSEMMANISAARMLCYRSGYMKSIGDPESIMEVTIAKYFASTMVTAIANDAMQIHGAIGFSGETSIPRYVRDAKVMEIIEGSTQIQNIIIAKHGVNKLLLEKHLADQ